MGQSRPLFVYFRHFLIKISIIQIQKAKMVCLGFEPAAARWMVGADKTTELWRPPKMKTYSHSIVYDDYFRRIIKHHFSFIFVFSHGKEREDGYALKLIRQ